MGHGPSHPSTHLPTLPCSEAGGQLRRKWMDGGYVPSGNEWQDPNTLHFEQDLANRWVGQRGAARRAGRQLPLSCRPACLCSPRLASHHPTRPALAPLDIPRRGDPEAHRQLGYRMLTGNGLPRDLAGAAREFEIAARGGDPYAAFNLGFMHIKGLHYPQNYTAARLRFEEAAAKSLPSALNGLGAPGERAGRRGRRVGWPALPRAAPASPALHRPLTALPPSLSAAHRRAALPRSGPPRQLHRGAAVL